MSFTPDKFRLYRQSEQGKAVRQRYEESGLAKASRKRYEQSPKGRETQRLNRVRRHAANRKLVLEAKSNPCIDCGKSFDPICMDFHHIRGKKKFSIGWGRHTPAMLIEEIAKCVVICSNCHRLRHKRPDPQ